MPARAGSVRTGEKEAFNEESEHRWSVIIASFNTVLIYLLFAALNGWLLILWYQYNRRRTHVRRRQPGYFHQEELARSFNVSPQIISEMSQYNLLTVYHDRIGRIIDLKISQQDEEEE